MGWGPIPVTRWVVRIFGAVDLALAIAFGGITAMLSYFAFFSWPSGDEWVIPAVFAAVFGLCSTVLIGIAAGTLLRCRYNRRVTTALVWSAAGLVMASIVTFTVLVVFRGVDGGLFGMVPLICSAAAFGAARWARSSFPVPPPRPYRPGPTGPHPPPGTPPVGPPSPPPGTPLVSLPPLHPPPP